MAILDGIAEFILGSINGPWLLPLVFAATVIDAVLVFVPSEAVIVALGAIAVSAGWPETLLLIAVAAAGAISGDSLTYWSARGTQLQRFRWAQRPRAAAAFRWAGASLDRRAASALLTARFIPYGRVVVNVTAGTSHFPYPRFLLLTSIAGSFWASYNVLIGALFGQLFADNIVLAVVISVAVALGFGLVIDFFVQRASAKKHPRGAADRAAHEPTTV